MICSLTIHSFIHSYKILYLRSIIKTCNLTLDKLIGIGKFAMCGANPSTTSLNDDQMCCYDITIINLQCPSNRKINAWKTGFHTNLSFYVYKLSLSRRKSALSTLFNIIFDIDSEFCILLDDGKWQKMTFYGSISLLVGGIMFFTHLHERCKK